MKVTAVGGFGEIGRNMTVVDFGPESVAIDMGIHLDHMIELFEIHGAAKLSTKQLMDHNCLPNDMKIDKKKVVAIVASHGHLDHIAGIPYLEKRYDAPIVCTAFTAKIIERQFKDGRFRRRNKIVELNLNKTLKVGKGITIEFISMTHSIPHTAMVVLHGYGKKIAYLNDFKIDDTPPLGLKINYPRIKELQGEIDCLLMECLNVGDEGRTPSEMTAIELLEDALLNVDTEGKGVFVTTFASHIARLQTIVSVAKKLNRKVVFLGRSLEKYCSAAKDAGVSDLIDFVDACKYRPQVAKKLTQLQSEDLSKYLIVFTGNQGEKEAVLHRMLTGQLPNVFSQGDICVFSCNIIPTKTIIAARQFVESKLEQQGVHVITDIHVSGHASKEDLRQMLQMVKPKLWIPSHGEPRMEEGAVVLAKEEGIKIKIIHDADFVELD